MLQAPSAALDRGELATKGEKPWAIFCLQQLNDHIWCDDFDLLYVSNLGRQWRKRCCLKALGKPEELGSIHSKVTKDKSLLVTIKGWRQRRGKVLTYFAGSERKGKPKRQRKEVGWWLAPGQHKGKKACLENLRRRQRDLKFREKQVALYYPSLWNFFFVHCFYLHKQKNFLQISNYSKSIMFVMLVDVTNLHATFAHFSLR